MTATKSLLYKPNSSINKLTLSNNKAIKFRTYLPKPNQRFKISKSKLKDWNTSISKNFKEWTRKMSLKSRSSMRKWTSRWRSFSDLYSKKRLNWAQSKQICRIKLRCWNRPMLSILWNNAFSHRLTDLRKNFQTVSSKCKTILKINIKSFSKIVNKRGRACFHSTSRF